MPFTFTFLAPVSSCLGLCIEGFGWSPRGAPAEISFCREEEKPWRHDSTVNQYPARSHSWFWPPSPARGSIELPEPLLQGSHNSEMTWHRCQSTGPSSSVPLDLEDGAGGMVYSPVLASCLYYHSKWLKASLLLSLWLIVALISYSDT